MVAVKVASFPSQLIFERTLVFSLIVSTLSPTGALKLSGDTALAIASAVFALLYSIWIVACNSFAP